MTGGSAPRSDVYRTTAGGNEVVRLRFDGDGRECTVDVREQETS